MLYLSGLVLSSKYYWDRKNKWITYSFFYFLLCLAGIYFGFILELDGLRNTVLVYTILMAMSKLNEFYFTHIGEPVVYVFFTCAILYYIALKLNQNPEFIVSIFKNND